MSGGLDGGPKYPNILTVDWRLGFAWYASQKD
jgi:hypothetical protein